MSASPSNRLAARPTSAPSVDDSTDSPASMQRSTSADHNKVSKRKGTRSVSTLTPAQLARKRANDREAQRAIRARTKEHIERLEAELEELRNVHSRDQAVKELLRRNRMLEDELRALRESVGLAGSHHSSAYQPAAPYAMNGSLASPRTSPYPASDFSAPPPPPAPQAHGSLPDYTSAGYGPFAGNGPSSVASGSTSCDTWAAPGSTTSVPSNVSSPCSTNDEYGTGPAYLPTSAPNPMVPSSAGLRHLGVKMEYEDGNDHGFPLEQSRADNSPPMALASNGFLSPQQQQAPAWSHSSNMYYTAMPNPVY